MSDKSWKAFERRIAKKFGGERRGADFRDRDGGKNDIILDGWSIECKLLGKPQWGLIVSAVDQAKDAREKPNDIPIAVVKKKGQGQRTLVIMGLEDFLEFFG